MAKRDREINIFNIAFLDVITGAMGAFVLLVILLSPYYSGADPKTLKRQEAAQAAVDQAKKELQQAQQAAQNGGNDEELKKALAKAQADLDDARKELDGLKQQLDQLSAQNKRLTDLDDQQQKELKEAEDRIADLERKVAQSTKEALDRAEQAMRQADQAIQSGNVEDLRRLLAQARADLAEARKQLDALNQELEQTRQALKAAQDENAALQAKLAEAAAKIEDLSKQLAEARAALAAAQEQIAALNARLSQALAQLQQMQQALVQAQQQRDRALAQLQQMQQALAQAQQQRDQAINERDRFRQMAAARQTLDQAAPVPSRWVFIDAIAAPTCNNVDFHLKYYIAPIDGVPATPGFTTEKEILKYLDRGTFFVPFIPYGAADQAKQIPAQPYHREFMLSTPLAEERLLIEFQAKAAPPPGCQVTAQFSMNVSQKDGSFDWRYWQVVQHFADTRPILFGVVPPGQDVTPTAADVAIWNKLMQPAHQEPATGSRP